MRRGFPRREGGSQLASASDPGFTLAELLLASFLFVVAVLALVALTASSLQVHQKAGDMTAAVAVADRELSRAIYDALHDRPAGARHSFWNQTNSASTPFYLGDLPGYRFALYATDVVNTTGANVGTSGSAADNRLKQVDIVVWWWDSQASNGTRAGYGTLRTQATRIVNEVYVQ